MRQVSLREFRTRGAKALEAVPRGETVLLSGQKGPAYYLVPVMGDIATEEQELRQAMARASFANIFTDELREIGFPGCAGPPSKSSHSAACLIEPCSLAARSGSASPDRPQPPNQFDSLSRYR